VTIWGAAGGPGTGTAGTKVTGLRRFVKRAAVTLPPPAAPEATGSAGKKERRYRKME